MPTVLYAGQVSSSTGDGRRQTVTRKQASGRRNLSLVLSGYRMLPAEELEGDGLEVQTFRIPRPIAPVVARQQPCIAASLHGSPRTRCGRIEAMAPPSKHKCRRSQIHGISSAISICSTSLHVEKAGDPFCTSRYPSDLFLHDYTLSILQPDTTIGQPQQPE